jgi:hypothetical protein
VHPWAKEEFDINFTLQDRGLEVSFKGTEVLIHPRGLVSPKGR